MSKKMKLEGQTVLVTGASAGLGIEFSRQLAAKGADIILVARRKEQLDAVAKSVSEEYGVQTYVYVADLSVENAPQKLYDRIKNDGLQVDILINNAGFGLSGFFSDSTWEKQNAMIDVNIKALTQLTRLFLEDMKKNNSGQILLVASTAAYQPTPIYAVYGATKAYVLSFGEALRYELKRQKLNIHVSVLSPGPTATEFFKVANQRINFFVRLFTMHPKKVAKIGINGMLHNKPSRVAGFINWLMATLIRFTPRRIVPPIAYRTMK